MLSFFGQNPLTGFQNQIVWRRPHPVNNKNIPTKNQLIDMYQVKYQMID
jgi:hypothetical protein